MCCTDRPIQIKPQRNDHFGVYTTGQTYIFFYFKSEKMLQIEQLSL